MARLFGVVIPELNVKVEEETKRRNERKFVRIFEQEIVPQRRKSAIKKTHSSSLSLPSAPLPFPLVVQMIHDMERKNLHFVTKKIFELSDIAINQNIFFIPKSKVLWGFLSNGEKTLVEGRMGLEVMVVDSRGAKYSMKLKKWKNLNQIVLNGGWRKVVEDNTLKAEVDCAEVWNFRADSNLCFAFDVKKQLQY